MALSTEDQGILDRAKEFVRDNRKAIAKELTDPSVYLPEEEPVSVFMAGSPGAGKTEASIVLLAEHGDQVLRIDPDELRTRIPGYNDTNAPLFQGPWIFC